MTGRAARLDSGLIDHRGRPEHIQRCSNSEAGHPATPTGKLLCAAETVMQRVSRRGRCEPNGIPTCVNYRRVMAPVNEELVMYGSPAEARGLEWRWVAEQLVVAGAYWTVTPSSVHPHPRPVWGVWLDDVLYLSIGSPRLSADARDDAAITVHLGSVTDVVIVEGFARGQNSDAHVLAAYNAKYEWDYTIAEYGPFTTVVPGKVMAWRSAGWAGREGFQQTGRWRFDALGG